MVHRPGKVALGPAAREFQRFVVREETVRAFVNSLSSET
jgi:hypothetical protein